MKVKMNIGLNSEHGLSNAPEAQLDRLNNFVRKVLRMNKILNACQIDAKESRYQGPDGKPVVERTIIAAFDFRPGVERSYVKKLAYVIAVDMGQDCVAVKFADGDGVLAGPLAEKWGAFNPEFFIE